MRIIKKISQLILTAILLSSCKKAINEDILTPISEEILNENIKSEKKRIEIKFYCGIGDISEYLDDGWIILKEDSLEKICTWKSVPASKD